MKTPNRYYLADSDIPGTGKVYHIHSKIRNRLEPETTEKVVYVYSNSKMVAATRDADELKMFAWDNEDV